MGPTKVLLLACLSVGVAEMATHAFAAPVDERQTNRTAQAPRNAPDEAAKIRLELERAQQLEAAVLREKLDQDSKARAAAQALKELEGATAIKKEVQRKRLRTETRKRAAPEREEAPQREPQQRELPCEFKPVMTDDEIARCGRVRG